MAYTVKAVFGSESIVKTDTIYQYNSGQVLQIEGLAFTNSTEFHLAIHGKDTAYVMTGTIANNTAKITIPEVLMINDFCTCNYRIDVFVYVIDNSSGYTKYKIIIPVKSRPRPEGYYVDLPTVPELKSLKQELNTAVNNFNDAYTEIDQLKSETASLKEDLGDIASKDSDRLNLYDGISYRQGYYDGSKWTTFGKSLIIASGLVKYNDRLTFSEDALMGSTYYTVCIDDENNILVRPQNNTNTIAFTNEALKEKVFSVYVRVPEDYDISKFIAVIGSKIPDTWTLGEKVNFSLKDGSVTHNTIANNTIKTKNIEPKAITANCTSFLYENAIINNIYDGLTYKNGHWDGTKWVDWGTTKSLKINLGLVQFRDNLCVSADSAVNGTYSISMFDREDTFIHQTANTNNVLSMTNAKLQNKTFCCYVRVPIDYDISSFIAVIGDNIPTGYGLNDVTKVYEQSLPKYLQRKSLVIDCLGDSFTAPSTAWHDYLRKKTGWKILNHGVSSSRISIDKKVTGELDTDGNVINKTVLSFLNRVSDIDINADAVIIFGGINDAYSINDGSITIGTIDSELDTTTFYGALKKLIVDIRNKMPSKKIIGVIPPDFMPTESYINTLPLVQDACRKVYRFYGIPFADLKYNCQEMYESDYNNSVYRLVSSSVDNYHPSDLGHEAIAKIIYKTVSGIIDF